jgi:hypothetical protein
MGDEGSRLRAALHAALRALAAAAGGAAACPGRVAWAGPAPPVLAGVLLPELAVGWGRFCFEESAAGGEATQQNAARTVRAGGEEALRALRAGVTGSPAIRAEAGRVLAAAGETAVAGLMEQLAGAVA